MKNKFGFASAAGLMSLALLVAGAGCAAPVDGTQDEKTGSSSEALTQGHITLTLAGSTTVTVTGTGFTPGAQVQLFSYDVYTNGPWAPRSVVTASSCPRIDCLVTSEGKFTTTLSVPECSPIYVEALDEVNHAYSNEPLIYSEDCTG